MKNVWDDFKIKNIEVKGDVDIRRIYSIDNYFKTMNQMEKEGIFLPNVDDLPFDIRDCRVQLNDMVLRIHIENSKSESLGCLEYKFYRGFVTDFASVPKNLRGRVENDSPEIVLPSYPHDGNFRYNYLSFEFSNMLFRKMMKYYKASWWLRMKAWFAVSTYWGRKAYNEAKPLKNPRMSFKWLDK